MLPAGDMDEVENNCVEIINKIIIVASSRLFILLYVCRLGYSACSAHALHFHVWPAEFYNVFSTLCHKQHDFRKKKKGYSI